MSTATATALAAPFPADVIGWKAQAVSKSKDRALAVPYLSARDVMDRLDAVVGVAGWEDEYQQLPGGAVLCRLTVTIDGKRVCKEDVGASEMEDDGGKTKAAFSSALKRAAVKFGIGRYLYAVPKTWVPYDEAKKQLKEIPRLPAWALPAKPVQTSAPAGNGRVEELAPAGNGRVEPTGASILARLRRCEAEMVRAGRCRRGDLIAAAGEWAREHDLPDDPGQWPPAVVWPYALSEELRKFVEAWQLSHAA